MIDSQKREVVGLIRALSSDLTVLPSLVVEALQEDDTLQELVRSWLMRNDVKYYEILRAFNEVF